MTLPARSATVLTLVTALLLMMVVLAASPARADNCEVTELVLGGGYEEPGEESAKPQCIVLQNGVYPIIGCSSPAECQANGVDPQLVGAGRHVTATFEALVDLVQG